MAGTAINFGPVDRRIADQLRARRERFGMPFNVLERQLAERGRPIPALGLRRIERYERRIDADDLVALAACLELDPLDVFAKALEEVPR